MIIKELKKSYFDITDKHIKRIIHNKKGEKKPDYMIILLLRAPPPPSLSETTLICIQTIGNIDQNAIGNCDSVTGKCLRCTQNTTGDQCQSCLSGYWGNALADIKCHACECHVNGSLSSECDLDDGKCSCKPNVLGRQCDQCEDTFWNLDSGEADIGKKINYQIHCQLFLN